MYGNNSGQTFCDVMHAHLENVLVYFEPEWYAKECVSPILGIECG